MNLELINNLVKAYTLKSPDFTVLLAKISNLKELFKRKSETSNKLVNKRGKNLIDRQITEEFRRKIEENSELYKEQIKETGENVDNKEEYIKIFEKKLKEVEIYVQKHTKNLVHSKFEIYKNFKMIDFINENTDLLKKKELENIDNKQLLVQSEEIKKENNKLGSSPACNNNNVSNNNFEISFKNVKNEESERKKSVNNNNSVTDMNIENKRNSTKAKYENSKVSEIMKHYNNQIKILESKNKLRASLNTLKSKVFNSKCFNLLCDLETLIFAIFHLKSLLKFFRQNFNYKYLLLFLRYNIYTKIFSQIKN